MEGRCRQGFQLGRPPFLFKWPSYPPPRKMVLKTEINESEKYVLIIFFVFEMSASRRNISQTH